MAIFPNSILLYFLVPLIEQFRTLQAAGNQTRREIENPTKKVISAETKSLIDKLLLERISLYEIARVIIAFETSLTMMSEAYFCRVVSYKPLGQNLPGS